MLRSLCHPRANHTAPRLRAPGRHSATAEIAKSQPNPRQPHKERGDPARIAPFRKLAGLAMSDHRLARCVQIRCMHHDHLCLDFERQARWLAYSASPTSLSTSRRDATPSGSLLTTRVNLCWLTGEALTDPSQALSSYAFACKGVCVPSAYIGRPTLAVRTKPHRRFVFSKST